MELQELCQLTQDISGVSVHLLRDEGELRRFCARYQFHTRQDYLDPDILQMMQEEMKPGETISSTDAFHIRFLFCRLGSALLVIGGYCTEQFSENDCKLLFRQLGLPDIPVRDFQAYRSTLPVVAKNYPLHLLRCITRGMNWPVQGSSLREIDFNATATPAVVEVIRRPYSEIVNERYRIELEFMQSIRDGDHVSAIAHWKELHRAVEFMRVRGDTLENARNSASINRTTIRIAAMDVGITPIVNDQLSGESADRIRSAVTLDEINQEHERIIREYCYVIRDMKKNHYSSLVQTVLYYIEHKYAVSITVEGLAKELEVTPGHLITKFKQETGSTPKQYLSQVRLNHAVQMLTTSGKSVQEISAAVGLEDAGYFGRLFKKSYGVTPEQYRKARRRQG